MPFADLIKMAKELRKPLKDAMESADYIKPGEEKIGLGDNNLTLAPDGVDINNEDPAVGGSIKSTGSDLKFGGQLRTDLAIDRLIYEQNKTFNPQIQYRPQNIVSYYPTTITLPPTFVGGLLKGALGIIMQVARKLPEDERAG